MCSYIFEEHVSYGVDSGEATVATVCADAL